MLYKIIFDLLFFINCRSEMLLILDRLNYRWKNLTRLAKERKLTVSGCMQSGSEDPGVGSVYMVE